MIASFSPKPKWEDEKPRWDRRTAPTRPWFRRLFSFLGRLTLARRPFEFFAWLALLWTGAVCFNQPILGAQAPSVSVVSSLSLLEDSGTTNINLTVTGVGDVTVAAICSNTNLVSVSNLVVSGTGAARTLAITPETNAFGKATIRLIAAEGQTLSTNTISLTIVAVNDRPAFGLATNIVAVDEDTVFTFPSFVIDRRAGPTNESSQGLIFTLSVDNSTLFANPPAVSASGALSFKPAADRSGVSQVRIGATDTGGVTFGGTNQSDAQTFTITVTPVNDRPVLSLPSKLSLNEDGGTTNITMSVSDVDNAAAEITLTSHSSNQSLLPDDSILLSGNGTNRTMLITPLANAFGTAVIQVIASDGQASMTNSLVLTVNPINDPPSFTLATNVVTVAEDTAVTFTNFVASVSKGPTNESSQTLLYTLSTANRSFFAKSPAISASGTLSFTPAPNISGTNEVTVSLQDNGGTLLGGGDQSEPQTFRIVVTAVNDAPTLSIVRTLALVEDRGATNITFSLADLDNDLDTLNLTIRSSNTSLVPNENLVTTGNSTNRILTITALTNAFGTAQIQLVVSDGLARTTNSVALVVSPVNDPPTFSLSTNVVTVAEDVALVLSSFVADSSVGPTNESGQTLSFSVDPENKAFFAIQPTINSGGALTLKPASNVHGTNIVRVVLQDTGGTAFGGVSKTEAQIFRVVVTPVNDPPALSLARSAALNEDGAPATIAFSVTDPDTELGSVTVTATSSNTSLVPNENLVTTGNSTNRILTITSLTNAYGTATIQLVASDGEARVTNSVSLTVTGVNDRPSFALLTNVVHATEDTAFTLTNFVASASKGPANEASQTLTFSASTSNTLFYAVQPLINSAGTLSFKPAANVTGTNELTVVALDNGGFALGGTNRSEVQTFRVVIDSVNDAPSISIPIGRTLSILEDSGTTNVTFTVADPDTDISKLELTLASSNQGLVANDSLIISGSGRSRTLLITPFANAFGTTTIQLAVSDGEARSTNSLLLTVIAVNDRPSFTLSTNVIAATEDALFTRTNFVASLSAGPANESSQALTFVLTTSNRNFYATQPSLTSGGTLSFKPAADVNGTNEVTVVLQDSGGALFGGTNRSESQTVRIVVGAVNDPPTLNIARAVVMNEDFGTTNLSFTVSDPELNTIELVNSVTVTASSSNTNVVSATSLSVTTTGSARTLSLTPSTNAFGTIIITLVASDGQSSSTNSLLLIVNPVNDPPGFRLATNTVTTLENTTLILTNFATGLTVGPTNESSQTVSFLLTPADQRFFSTQPTISSSGSLILKPAKESAGSTEVSVVIQDSGGVSFGGTNRAASQTFRVVVVATNDPPTLSLIRTLSILEDGGTTNLTIIVKDQDTAIDRVTLTATSSNPTLIPNTNLVFSGTGTNRTLALTPLTNAFGTASIQVVAMDDLEAKSTNSFQVFVSGVNDGPSFNLTTNLAILLEDTSLVIPNFATNLVAGPTNETSQGLVFRLTPEDANFFATTPTINNGGALTLKPASNVNGTNIVRVVLQDTGGTAFGGVNQSEAQTFRVIVTGTNDPPALSLLQIVRIDEDSGPTNITMTVSDDNPLTNVTVTATSAATNLIANTNLVLTLRESVLTVTITPLTNANGSTVLTFIASDHLNALSTNRLTVIVNAVNDAPSFALSTNLVSTTSNSGLVKMTNFAATIKAGPANEASQSLTFVLTPENTAFFKVQPILDSAGLLSFVTATNASESTVISVVLQDTGGTSFGGTNRSPAQTFRITAATTSGTPTLGAWRSSERVNSEPGAALQHAESDSGSEILTVHPAITDDLLPNPFKGFVTRVADFFEDPVIPQSLVYAEMTWRELEPVRGLYNWAALEDGWAQHLKMGRRIGFSVRLADPKNAPVADIPEWLSEAGVALRPCLIQGVSGHAPDWDDELLLQEHDRLVTALGERYNHDPRIAWVDVASYGLWGQWQMFGNDQLVAQPSSRLRLLFAYLRAFPDKQLAIPYSDDLATRYFTDYGGGLRNGFLGSSRENAWYMESLARVKDGLNDQVFRRAVITGEFAIPTAALIESLTTRFDENLAFVRETHWSWMGPSGGSLVNPPPALRRQAEALYQTLGYRFAITELSHPGSVLSGQPIRMKAKVVNLGAAPFYYPWPVHLSLIGASGQPALAADLTARQPSWDPRTWIPGEHALSLDLALPPNTLPGRYTIALAVIDPATGQPGVRLANPGRTETGWYPLSTIEIQDSTPGK